MNTYDTRDSLAFSQHVSERIKFYRKLKHMSLETLSQSIHKSKSTVSKYENGHISVDVETLYEIAEVLEINISQFLDFKPANTSSYPASYVNPFGKQTDFFLYYYDGRTKKVTKTLLLLNPVSGEESANTLPCSCYMDVPSFEKYHSCKYFYTGTMEFNDLVSYIRLNNLNNPIEQINMCLMNPFHQAQDTYGLMMGISYNPITPFTLKFTLSKTPIAESLLKKETFALQKDELKNLRTLNMLLLNTIVP